MTLRTRLIVAFLLMSVVPLTVVTAYSYVSTRDAFRQSAQIKSDLMAEELGRRMEIVTGDIERRVGRIWRTSRPGVPPPGGGPGAPAPNPEEVARTLGNFAALVEKLEWVPGPGALPPGPPPGPPPGAPSAPGVHPLIPPGVSPPQGPRPPEPAGGPPRSAAPTLPPTVGRPTTATGTATSESTRVVIEMPTPAVPPDQSRVSADMQAAIVEATDALRREAAQAAAQTRQAAGAMRQAGDRQARMLNFRVMEDGQNVGTIRMRLNLERTLRGVLAMTRRDQGEIPFAVDTDGVVHTPEEADQSRLAGLDLASRARAQRTGRSADGDWVIVTREMPQGVIFGIARPIGGSLAELRRAGARNLGLGLSFIALALVGIVPLSNRMTRNLRTLTQGVERVAAGDLSAQVEVRSRDEFGRLAAAFNRMAGDITAHQHLVVEQERLRRELELSRQIQNEMLPHGTLRVGIAEVKGVSIPAREVGGDFFNYFPMPAGELALLVGDVSGKGIGAALLMANIQATLRARLPLETDLAALADLIDRDVYENTPSQLYLTLFVGILDPTGRTLRYVNAGHNPQFILRADGSLDELPATGVPVGLLPGRGYEEKSVSIGKGDLLFFYTDGTVEITNEQGEFFGHERLAAVITRDSAASVEAILADAEEELRAFRGSAEQSDDATMMALRPSPHAA
jgi:serine phosphatase RsbU (regulator of sigma subunit)